MTAATLGSAAAWLADRLVAGSIEGVLIVTLVWCACRWVRLTAAMQSALWWAVAFRLLLVFAPAASVPIPVLSPDVRALPSMDEAFRSVEASPVLADRPDVQSISWLALLVAIWLVGLTWHAARLLMALRAVRRTIRHSSRAIDDAPVAGGLARTLRLTAVPDVRVSSEVRTPQVTGVWRPVVLLPADAALTPEERLMALGHEFMHIRRRDIAFGWIPAIAERVFFFHPLVRLAAREHTAAREAACDAALIRALGVEPDDYGRLLLRFGVSGPRPAWVAGGAPGSTASLRRRLNMLEHLSRRPRPAAWLAVAVLVIALVPGHLVARAQVSPVPPAAPPVAVDPPQLLLPAPALMAVAPVQEPREPVVEPAPVSPEQWERETSIRFFSQQLEELQRALKAAEVQNAVAEAQSELRSRAVQEMQEAIAARARQASQAAEAGARAQQELAAELEGRAKLLWKELEAQQKQMFAQQLADRVNPTDRQLRERLEELATRLEMLADMQRQLQQEAEQLKRELGAAK